MDNLAQETWDVVIAGTGLTQALLALSLSRSDLKILHVDENAYYGGSDAGLSLDEAKSWADLHNGTEGILSSASICQLDHPKSELAKSRTYTLSLNPQIIYAHSTFLASLVSSTVNNQLEFMAVGSWWIHRHGRSQKVPSSREDVFADEALSRRDKVGLMKFLRHVLQEDSEDPDTGNNVVDGESLYTTLDSKFRVSPVLHSPISSLALSQRSLKATGSEAAVGRIRRHMKSVGYFGPGFGAVIAKYASNAEIAQVCCRSCAVGGATYLLGQGISDVRTNTTDENVVITLTNGISVKSRYLASGMGDLPGKMRQQNTTITASASRTCHSINIVSSPLKHLFPPTAENGPVPAAAIVLMAHEADIETMANQEPVYLQIHSEDTGECPKGQCIIYASTHQKEDGDMSTSQHTLKSAVVRFIEDSVNHIDQAETSSYSPAILWSMSYTSTGTSNEDRDKPFILDATGRVVIFPSRSYDIAFDDSVLLSVKAAWKKILGDAAHDDEFLRFEDRSGTDAHDE